MSFAENKLTISRAFTRFKRRKEEICEKGMYDLLNAALKYLDEAHDLLGGGIVYRHQTEDNTLGWALIRDGQIVEAVAHNGGKLTPYGDVLGRLQSIVSSFPEGYCGVVMSDMANSWYRWDWEQNFLSYSADNIKEEFFNFFKPI